MSNRERAAKIIHHMTGDPQRAHDVANELADAGLLAPDLPKPDECPQDIHKPGWQIDDHGNHFAAVIFGQIHISDRFGWGNIYTPDQIRTAAHKLLAAANHAERKTND